MADKSKPRKAGPMVRTSLYIHKELLHELKVAAVQERITEGVSGLLSRIAEEWLARRKGGR